MNEEYPIVSVLILNYNGKKLLEVCLPSLYNQDYKNIELIVIDNNSNDNSVEFVKKYYPDIKIIVNRENLGFSEANNIGIKQAIGQYIFILNNDTEVDRSCVKNLIEVAEKNKDKVGMFATKVLSYYQRDTIDNLGHLIYQDGLNRGRARLEKDHGQYEKIEEVCFPSGCAALYRKDILNSVGLFDEDFYYFGEDTDLGLRIRLAGWICLYILNAIVYHMYSASVGKYSHLKALYVERNRLWVAVKLFPLSLILLSPYYTFKRYLYQIYGVITKKGSSGKFAEEFSSLNLVFILAKAWLLALAGLPKMIRKRKMVNRKISNKEVYSWFSKFGISAKELTMKD